MDEAHKVTRAPFTTANKQPTAASTEGTTLEPAIADLHKGQQEIAVLNLPLIFRTVQFPFPLPSKLSLTPPFPLPHLPLFNSLSIDLSPTSSLSSHSQFDYPITMRLPFQRRSDGSSLSTSSSPEAGPSALQLAGQSPGLATPGVASMNSTTDLFAGANGGGSISSSDAAASSLQRQMAYEIMAETLFRYAQRERLFSDNPNVWNGVALRLAKGKYVCSPQHDQRLLPWVSALALLNADVSLSLTSSFFPMRPEPDLVGVDFSFSRGAQVQRRADAHKLQPLFLSATT